MKRNDITALHGKTVEELVALLAEKKEALLKARMELAQNKLKNVRLLSTLRDDIARVETVRRQKEEKDKT